MGVNRHNMWHSSDPAIWQGSVALTKAVYPRHSHRDHYSAESKPISVTIIAGVPFE
jgi:hypothetical protein